MSWLTVCRKNASKSTFMYIRALGLHSAASYANVQVHYHPEECFVGELDVLVDSGQNAEYEADQNSQETARKQTIMRRS